MPSFRAGRDLDTAAVTSHRDRRLGLRAVKRADPGTSMLKTRLLHPQILEALGEAGHGARVLIADGNYPLATQSNPAGRRVYLNLAPGRLGVIEVLEVLAESIPIEAAHVMGPDDSSEPPIYADFRHLLPGTQLERLGRFEFYAMARGPDTALAIATGEQRLYANVLLTIGVVPPA